MKNLLLMAITILLAVLIGIIMVKGINIANIELFSIQQIKEKNEYLKQKETEANSLNLSQYKATMQNLEKAQKELKSNKNDYLDIASTSTEEEIKEANQTQVYAMEYLWGKIGNYATENGIQLKMDVTESQNSSKSTLEFSAIGYYKSISDFIYEIEKDSDLNFRVQNFKLIDFKIDPNNKDEEYKESLLQASFTIDNVEIKKENVTTQVQIETEEDKKDKANENNTNAENTETENKETENTSK